MGKSGGRRKKGGNSGNAAAEASAGPSKTPPPPPPPPPSVAAASPIPNGNGISGFDASVLLKRAHELKEEGNRLFQAKDYAGALRQYELALRLTPRGHTDRAVFHSNRAACLMLMRPVNHEAVAAECSLALQAQPGFPRALLRRARALEALKHYELALQDVQSLMAVDPTNSDAIDLARRLRSALSAHRVDTSASPSVVTAAAMEPGSRPSPAALGASAVRVGAPVAGLGPSLPSRSKKTSPPPPPQRQHSASTNKPFANSSQIIHQTSSPVLPNGIHPKPQPTPQQQKSPAEIPISEASSGPPFINSSSDNSKLHQNKGKESSLEGPVTSWRPLKLVYDHDIRLAQMPANCRFKILREIVANRFPSSKSVLIKYRDADGDLVTMTSTAELRLAESCVDQLNKNQDKEGVITDKNDKQQLLRLHIVEVSSDQEPQVPEEEGTEEKEEKPVEDEELLNSGESGDDLPNTSNEESATDKVDSCCAAKNSSEEAPSKEKAGDVKKECDHAECKEAEIDDWLFEFAQLFRNQVGIDPDAHVDFHELGMELCSEALEEAVTSDDAQNLFVMAAAKFQEVAALAFFNWGNVHMCAARKRVPLDESSPKEVMGSQLQTAYDWVREKYDLAAQKYEEAIRIKPDFYEGLLALGQQQFESAKLHWSFALASKIDFSTWDSTETLALFDSAEEKMKAATEMWEKVEEQRSLELKDPGMSKKDEILKNRKKPGIVDNQGELSAEEAAEQATVMRSQIHLFWGNMLFERSQVEFKLEFGNWKKNLDAAVERFKQAGASEADISVVLKNHASNRIEVACEDKNVTNLINDSSESNALDEDKHVLEG